MSNQTIQELSRTWIPGIPEVPLSVQEKPHTAFDWTAQTRLLFSLLQHRGERATLQDVMASSGDAFHLSHAARWELRTAHAMPVDPLMIAAQAFGYAASWTAPDWTPRLFQLPLPERLELTAKFLECLWAEIRAGRPLLFGGAFGLCSSWRILAGFDLVNEDICLVGGERSYEWTPLWDEKAREWGFWDMQVRGSIRQDEFLGGWQANACFLLGKKTKEITERERILDSLQLAVSLSLAPAHPTNWYGGVTYYFGQGAFKQWADDLQQLDFPDDLSAPRPESPDLYNLDLMGYQVDQVIQGRSAAADFCAKAARILDQPGLNQAAEAYKRQAATARAALQVFLQDDPETRRAWLSDPQQRKSGAVAVRSMLAQEKQAILWIQKTLGSLKS